jgi:[protein-PII] uridylyltransferase
LNAHGQLLDLTADWPYLTAVPEALRAGEFSPTVFRQVLDRGTELLQERFAGDEAVEDLVRDRARLVDITLRAAWVRHAGKFASDLALVAVGGYGRGELHPSSDIDIMVLLPKSDSADWQPDIEKFLTFLWDIGLEVGHSVRSIDDCQRESLADISVATTLFEAPAGWPRIAVRRHAPRAGVRPSVVLAGVLRSEGQGTDRAAPSLFRHRL